MNENKKPRKIRIVESGIEKEITTKTIKKVKLDKYMDNNTIRAHIEKLRNK